ncbi:MAG TPA: hypothetical protein PKD54_08600 [Pirellulaceae bacterium]|nr:hypothetical protein [Pirellulaceae bacterium]
MLRWASWGLSLCAVCLASSWAGAQDLGSLDGEWKPTAGVLHGQPVPQTALSSMKLLLTGGTFRGESSGLVSSGSFALDASGPSRLRFVITSGSDTGRNIPAMFRISGQQLTVVYSESGDFPVGFESTAGNRSLVMVYEKVSGSDIPAPVVSEGGAQSNSVVAD